MISDLKERYKNGRFQLFYSQENCLLSQNLRLVEIKWFVLHHLLPQTIVLHVEGNLIQTLLINLRLLKKN